MGLWRHPVKSMVGERRPALEMEPRGVALDRGWGVYGRDGRIGSGKSTRRFRRMSALHRCCAGIASAGELTVTLPDGTRVAGIPRIEQELSAVQGEPVRLLPEATIRHLDERPVHLITSTDLETLGELLGDRALADVRRFRPNLLLDASWRTDDEDLEGRLLDVGDAVLRLCEATERCVMVTFDWEELPSAPAVFEALARHRGRRFGRYATVERPGAVRVGDRAVLER